MRFGAVFNYFIKGYRTDGAKLLIWAHSEMTKGHVDKLQHEEMLIRDKKEKSAPDCTEYSWRTSSEMLRSGLHETPSCQVYFDLLGARVWNKSPPEGPSNLDDHVVFVAMCNLLANIVAIQHREKIQV